MTRIIAFFIFPIMGFISLLHFSWALGYFWPASNEQELIHMVTGVDMPQMYDSTITMIIAAMMMGIAIFPIIYTQLVFGALRRILNIPMKIITFLCFAVFTLRGIITYTAFWRDTHITEPFTTLDIHYFGPLCIGLGLGFFILLFDKTRQS